MAANLDSPDPAHEQWLEQQRLLRRFEDAWEHRLRPAIADYLPADSAARGAVLVELVHTDLEYRLKAGEPARVETYLADYPEVGADQAVLLDLVRTEYELRSRQEPDLSLAEYGTRFPDLVKELAVGASAEPPALTPHPAGPTCPDCHAPLPETGSLRGDESVACPSCGTAVRWAADPGLGAPPPGSRLGKYRLDEVVGRGSFAVVYRAHDSELDRTVAVKVPRLGALAGPAEVQRFLREARSAAQLGHPNIVTVHDVGEVDGVCYLASAFLEGVTLAERLRQGRLNFPAAVALLARVAEALDHAHARGVIHRDLKPSNIMLDAAGEPHLLDFGLAKRENADIALTLDGQLLGTPAYMAPEQARGDGERVDARSDVYSLGVILYELLTGEIPFRGTMRMVLRQTAEEEPRPPRQLNDRIPRDLETITLKALAKEPGRRYPGAGALAADLRRWQRGEPIHARPAGRLERAGRWCRRNPRVAGLLAALLLTFSAGFGGVFWQWQRAEATARDADRQRGLAQAEAAEAGRQRGLAEDNLRQACRAVDQFYTQVGANALVSQPGLEPLRRQLLQQALTFYQGFLARHGDAVFLQQEAAQAALNVAMITEQIGTLGEAEAAFQQAIDRYHRLVQAEPGNASWQHKLSESYLHRGRVLTLTDRLPEAIAATRQAAAIMDELAEAHPADLRTQMNRLAAYGNIARVELKLDHVDAARRGFERVRSLLEQLLRDHPGHVALLRNLALTEHNLSLIVAPNEALACLARARDVREQLVRLAPAGWRGRDDLARTDTQLGIILSRTGRHTEALASLQRAVASLEALAGEHPAMKEFPQHLAEAYLDLAGVQQKLQQRSAALTSLEKARALYQALLRDDPHLSVQAELATVCRDLGRLYRALDRPAEAAAAFRERGELQANDPWELLRLAWELTLCVPRTTAEGKNSSSADESLPRQLATQILANLRQAIHLWTGRR